MTAREILKEIQMIGGRLEARGDRLHVEAPKGVLKPQHRQALVTLKPEVLALLQQKSDERELEESMRRLEAAYVSIAVFEDGGMHVIQSETHAQQAQAGCGTVYTPADMWHYIQLEPNERRMLHAFKRNFGGTTEWKTSA